MVGGSDGVVADVGCGTGRVTSHVVDVGLTVRAHETTPQAFLLAHRA